MRELFVECERRASCSYLRTLNVQQNVRSLLFLRIGRSSPPSNNLCGRTLRSEEDKREKGETEKVMRDSKRDCADLSEWLSFCCSEKPLIRLAIVNGSAVASAEGRRICHEVVGGSRGKAKEKTLRGPRWATTGKQYWRCGMIR